MFAFRIYALGLTTVAASSAMLIMALAVYLVPLRNDQPFIDLLRTGWNSFNYFGYRSDQISYSPPLVTADEYRKYYDIVVLGDSFTNQLQYSWANRIAMHGWSVLIRPASKPIEPLLSSSEYMRAPPRIVILAVVERSLKDLLVSGAPCVADSSRTPPSAKPVLPSPAPRTTAITKVNPPERAFPNNDQITYARDFLINHIMFSLGSRHRATTVYTLTVARFSAVRSKDLLVLGADLAKQRWNEADINSMRCRLLEYRTRIEANGLTRFVFLPVPDKLSAYHSDLVDSSLPESILPRLIQPQVESPRLDLTLRRAIEDGQIDIYLPSDTHFGRAGYQVVADTVLNYLVAAVSDDMP